MFHQKRHMYQQLKPVLVVLDPKSGTIIKISISLLLNFYRKLKFEVGLFLGPLVYLFHQNVPPEAPHVLAVKIGSVGFRPKVWHQYHDISLL